MSKDLAYLSYKNTKSLHDEVDKHRFVKNISLNSPEAHHYIETVEYVLYILEQAMDRENPLYQKLRRFVYKPTPPCHPLFDKIQEDTMDPLLLRSQIYLWYVSLMAGGKLLRRKFDTNQHHLFAFTKDDKLLLKSSLNDIPESDHHKFIRNIAQTYKLIKFYFDDFYESTDQTGS
jgi:hypothetical protein